MIRIVLADDHPIVRKGLRTLLEEEPDCVVVGEAEDGITAVEMSEQLKPDVLVTDVAMPGLGGLEVARRVSLSAHAPAVIVLSVYSNETYVLEALRNGASAYVLKSTSTNTLVEAVRQVVGGNRYLSPPLTERAINAYVLQSARSGQELDRYDLLTNREREVLHMAAQGLSNQEIAERLIISPRTAETHRANLMRKLDLDTTSDLLQYALRRGIIVPNEQTPV